MENVPKSDISTFLTQIFIILLLINESVQQVKELSLGDNQLCSGTGARKRIKYESFVVDQGRTGHHPLAWDIPEICKFTVQPFYSKGGVIAVIQKLNLRKDPETGHCIDYVQFSNKPGGKSEKFCGEIYARKVMEKPMQFDEVLPYFPFSNDNSYYNNDSEMDVTIYIAKEPLKLNEETIIEIVFTSYRRCPDNYQAKKLIMCNYDLSFDMCISKSYHNNGYVNCPFYGCVDEEDCSWCADKDDCSFPPQVKPIPKISMGHRVIIGSISTLGILFAIFILIIWAFKKHRLFCWAEDFAHPLPPSESNRNSRVLEMNEQTGARLAEGTNVQPTAPEQDNKDLPPSYESLFPDRVAAPR